MLTKGPRVVPLPAHRGWAVLRGRSLLALVALLLTIGPVAGVTAYFQTAADTSPATGAAQVIAQGVIPIPATDVVWRIERELAPPPASASPAPATTGFVLGAEGAVLIEDAPAGEQSRLAPGEAILTRAGTSQVRAAIGATAAAYYVISLASADSAASATGELVFASEPFAGLDGRHDVDLVRDTLAAAETAEIPDGTGPTLLFVTAGAADFTTEAGELVTLAAEQAIALAGPLTVTTGSEGATILAAMIGPAVPRLTGPAAAAAAVATPEAAASPLPAAAEPAGTPTAAEQPADAAAPEPTAAPVDEAAADPVAVDTDGDGLSDTDEAALNSDPASVDTDGDGLIDGDEVLVYGTAPLAPDSDGDGLLDGDEVAQGTDPLNVDNDAGAAAPADGDSDGDGLPDSIEAELGTDPFDPDTDDDGLTDGDEYFTYQTGTRNPDTDGDGVLDGTEIENGTDPNDPNSF